MCQAEPDSIWGHMSDSPLKGVTEMTPGSDTRGMLLVKPPSKHLCRVDIKKHERDHELIRIVCNRLGIFLNKAIHVHACAAN